MDRSSSRAALGLALLVSSCSPASTGLEPVVGGEVTTPYPTDTLRQVLGFEDAALWSAEGGAVATSEVRSRGSAAVSVTGAGPVVLRSVPVPYDRGLEEWTLDLLPTSVPAGARLELRVASAACGLAGSSAGSASLDDLAADRWSTIHVEPPPGLRARLAGARCGDLEFTVVLDAPAGAAATALLDELRVRGPGEVGLAYTVAGDPALGTPLVVRSVDRAPIALRARPEDPTDAAAVARAVYSSYPRTFRLDDPGSELAVSEVQQDDGPSASAGKTHVKLQQRSGGLPVFGATSAVHLRADLQVSSVTGRTVPSPRVEPRTTVGPEQALALFQAAIPTADVAVLAGAGLAEESELGVYVPPLFGKTGATRVAYRVVSLEHEGFVDAETGVVLLSWDRTTYALDRRTWDGRDLSHPDPTGKATLTESSDLTTGCPAGVSEIACRVHALAAVSWEYFWERFRRDGWRGVGDPVVSYAEAFASNPETIAAKYRCDGTGAPAFANSSGMFFCHFDSDNWANGKLEWTVAHEYGHRVDASVIDRPGAGVPTQMEEATAEIWSCLIDGEKREPTFDHYDTRIDGGDPHENKGTLWFPMFYLSYQWTSDAEGRSPARIAVIGKEKVGHLLYQAMVKRYVQPSDGFYETGVHLAQACWDFWVDPDDPRFDPVSDMTGEDCLEVENALTATGMLGSFAVGAPNLDSAQHRYDIAPGAYGLRVLGADASKWLRYRFGFAAPEQFGPPWITAVVMDRETGTAQPVEWWLEDASGGLRLLRSPTLTLDATPGVRTVIGKVRFANGFGGTAFATLNVVSEVAPAIAITTPSIWSPADLVVGTPRQLEATVSRANGEFTVQWTSSEPSDRFLDPGDQDGSRSLAPRVLATSVGPRTITVTMTDSASLTAAGGRVFTASSTPPAVAITAPAEGATLYVNERAQLRATVSVPPGLWSSVSWTSSDPTDRWLDDVDSLPGDTAGSLAPLLVPGSTGPRTITLVAFSGAGLSSTTRLHVTASTRPVAPIVAMVGLVEAQVLAEGLEMALAATASDPNGGGITRIVWSSSEAADRWSGEGAEVRYTPVGPGPRIVAVTAVNAAGLSATDVVHLMVLAPTMYRLGMAVGGTGHGTVTAAGHEACGRGGEACFASIPIGTAVTLAAACDLGPQALGSWGGCDAVDASGRCSVTMTGDRDVWAVCEACYRTTEPDGTETQVCE
jgi:hypothetical protein